MSNLAYYIVCAVLVAGVLGGIAMRSRVKTAVAGDVYKRQKEMRIKQKEYEIHAARIQKYLHRDPLTADGERIEICLLYTSCWSWRSFCRMAC